MSWVDIQKRTFTNWVNLQLAPLQLSIVDIKTDFSDGVRLAALLQKLFGDTPRIDLDKKPKIRYHHINNVNNCLRFMLAKEIRLVGVGAEDIVDGHEKLLMGLMWTLIMRSDMTPFTTEGSNAKRGLLDWVQQCVRPTKLGITNFTTNWTNGQAFCALISAQRPNLIPWNTVGDGATESDAMINVERAFAAAASMGIPNLMAAEDSQTPDELSIMTHITQWYHYFARYRGVAWRDAFEQNIAPAFVRQTIRAAAGLRLVSASTSIPTAPDSAAPAAAVSEGAELLRGCWVSLPLEIFEVVVDVYWTTWVYERWQLPALTTR